MSKEFTKPGDLCIFVRDDLAAGRNIGKQCTVVEQCCHADCWTARAMEPVHVFKGRLVQCPAGDTLCCPKSNLRPLRDPDKTATPDPVAKPVETT